MDFNENLKWSKVVWVEEDKQVYSDVCLTKWIDVDNSIVYWPKYTNASKALKKNLDVDDKLFAAYQLLKVKIQSGKVTLTLILSDLVN